MRQEMEQILAELKEAFGELAGLDLGSADSGSAFLELGFDSLCLTQAAAVVKNRFGVKVTFRQLNEDLSSFSALADHLALNLPEPAASAVLAPAPRAETEAASEPAMSSGGVEGDRLLAGTSLEQVIKDQLRVMEMQLALVRGSELGKVGIPIRSSLPKTVRPLGRGESSTVQTATPSTAPTQHGPFRPLDKEQVGGLTRQQQAHLDWFIPRYVARTAKSKEYTQRHRRPLADPRAVAGFRLNWKEMVYPIVTTHSSGAHLWDLDGNKWVDVTMGFGVALLGHSPAFISDVLKRQLDLGVEIGPQSPVAGEVAELICDFTGMERVTFCNTGSEAVMAALRICRTVTGRSKVVLFAGSYHGTFDEVLVRGTTVNGEPTTLPLAPGVLRNSISEVVVLDYGAASSLEWIRAHADELAAVLVEPVQSRHPDLQPVEFLREVRKITQEAETPLIFDEVITGFRCHPGGAQALFGIQADLATYGKIIGGGMPFGFVAGKAWLMDAFDGGHWQYGDDSVPPSGVTFFAGTFVRHPLAMAAAKAMLHHLKEEGPELQRTLEQRTGRLTSELNRYFERNRIPIGLEHFTSVWYLHFGPDVKCGSLFYYHLREKGLHVWEGRPCFLSTAHTETDEAFIERSFKLSVAEMQHGGFLTGTSDSEYVDEARRLGAVVAPAGPQNEDEFPLTEAQKEVWVASQLSQEASCAFNETCSIYFTGPFDESAMLCAIQEVVRRHEALRTTFSTLGDVQRILPNLSLDVPLRDFSQTPAHERDALVQALQSQEGSRVFDLSKGPLVSMQILKLSEQEHVLVFTAHHIACDGWSYDVVMVELSRLYSAFKAGLPSPLERAKPFREYASWERAQCNSTEGRQAEAYWLQRFSSLATPLELPTDRRRPPVRSFRGSRISRTLPPDLSQAIKKASAKQRATLFTVLLAAFEICLYRLSGQDDLVIGVPSAGQNVIGSDRLVGHCANLLLLRSKVEPGQPFCEFLRSVKHLVLEAYEYQNFTFGSLLNKLKPPRDAGRMPLVHAFFNIDPPLSKIQFADLDYQIELNPRRCYQFDLGFNIVDASGTLVIECDHNTDLFEGATIERWLGHYQTLLEAIVHDPATPVDLLPLMSFSEREQLLSVWNRTDRDYPRGKTIHSLVAEQAARTPKATAVECQGQRLTFRALEHRANQLGNYLRKLGVGPDTLVGVCVDRSVDMVVGLLGVLKAGGAYVPIDPEFPRERIALMLEDAAPPVLVAHAALLARLPRTDAHIVCIDRDSQTIAREKTALDPAITDARDLAYVIYTSGSTGRPKGVEISHGAVVNLLVSMEQQPGLSSRDALLAVTTLSFDIAGLELFLPLTVGARVVVATRQDAVDPHRLMELMTEAAITTLQATPATWRMLLDAGWTGIPKLKALCGGEAITRDLADRLLERCQELWNMYGPTETTIWSTVCRLKQGEPITLGRPIANTRVYIVNDRLEPAPVGVPGELLIAGDGVARGYRNMAELTAKRFLPDPFRMDAGARAYRTGDLARFLPDGQIEFIGRSDFQVKIRGYRIELGEIETTLLSHPKVREAVVVARKDARGEQALVAYVAVPTDAKSGNTHWGEVWEALFENALREGANRREALEKVDSIIFGWTADQQDQAETEKQVGEWIDTTIRRIEALRPDKVLEIGCGMGQLLLRLAPGCSEFLGTDITAAAVEALRRRITTPGKQLPRVTLMQRPADVFDDIPTAHFDTVILNSVSQYFPTPEYLVRVMEGAVRATRPGGRIFVGDVQSYALLECYHATSQLKRLPADASVGVLRQTIQRRLAGEHELMVDPGFFQALRKHLSRISHVEIQMRRGRAVNETTQFHYDAILYVDVNVTLVQVQTWRDWESEKLDLHSLRQFLKETPSEVVGVRRVPNARLQKELAALELIRTEDSTTTVGEIRKRLEVSAQGVDPEDVWTLADEVGFAAEVSWHGSGLSGLMDVVFQRNDAGGDSTFVHKQDGDHAPPWQQFANMPARRSVGAELVPRLRDLIKSRLPDYMVPSAFIVLDSLPRTSNDKVDRGALPPAAPDQIDAGQSYVAPRTAAEKQLVEIWSEVLGLRRVGVTDNFFDLGGHSLLAVTVFAKIETAFGAKLPLATLFQAPTIEQLAVSLPDDVRAADSWSCLVPIRQRGTNPPFFCVHGAGGNILLYRELAHSLGDDFPFYGLQSKGLDGRSAYLTSIEEMAAYYLHEMCKVQPHGPYYLGGYCMGGLVAYEIAQQLSTRGEKVALLALLDTYNLSRALESGTGRMIRQRLRFHLGNLATLSLGESKKYIVEKLRIARDGELAQLFRAGEDKSRDAQLHEFGRGAEGLLQEVNDSAASAYQPLPYRGVVTVFKPRVNYDIYPDPKMGWGELGLGGVDLVELPVNPHAMLVQPYVQVLARGLKARLRDPVSEAADLAAEKR